MLPLQMMTQFTKAMLDATVDAQRATWSAGLATADRLHRRHEKPEDAAERAKGHAERGEAKSWYSRPPATWNEVAGTLTARNPFLNPFLNPFINPIGLMVPGVGWNMGWGTGWLGGPLNAKSAMGGPPLNPIAAMASAQMALPALLMTVPIWGQLAGPIRASVSRQMPTQPGSQTQNSGPTVAPVRWDQPDGSEVLEPKAEAGSRPASRQGSTFDVSASNAGTARGNVAIASILMPDNTVFKLEIPLMDASALTMGVWPWFAAPTETISDQTGSAGQALTDDAEHTDALKTKR